jgi:hypothetical protein
MRKQGIDVEDPTADDPALHISGTEGDSEKAEKVKATCETEIKASSAAN